MQEPTAPSDERTVDPAAGAELLATLQTAVADRPPAETDDSPADAGTVEPGGPPESDEPPPAPFWLRRGDQLVLAALCACLLLLSGWHWARLSGWGMNTVEIERHPSRQYEYRIDINSATWVEWIQLPGIGETLARRIVEDRRQNGPFEKVDDLRRVKGIGPKTIENLRPYLRVETPELVR